MGRSIAVYHHDAIENAGDLVAVDDNLMAIPFARRLFDVVRTPEAQLVAPFRRSAPPIESAAIARRGCASALPIKFLAGCTRFHRQLRLILAGYEDNVARAPFGDLRFD